MRKRYWAPVLVLAVGFAGFKGYGAYTRSKPVDYSRGGGDFAALPSGTPTATAGTTAAPVVPSVTAGPTAGVTSLPRTDTTAAPTVAPGRSTVTAAPQPTRTAAGVVVPRVGTYSLQVSGSEKVQFGPVSFCNQKLPSSTHVVVKKAAGESPTSYDFDVPFFPGKTGQHDERHIYRYTKTAVLLDYEIATVTCQGVRQSSETSFKPEQPRIELPLRVGASWHYKGGGSSRTEDATFGVQRAEYLTIQGRKVLTYVVHTATSFTGDESGTRDQTWWYAPSWAMPVKWHEKQSGHRSGASYSGDITATVVAGPQ
ncbi:MAG: hypothetical protein JWO22_225 [Frankiales bacterium]|nr:hypothetical protein [Frankiales bacterium]